MDHGSGFAVHSCPNHPRILGDPDVGRVSDGQRRATLCEGRSRGKNTSRLLQPEAPSCSHVPPEPYASNTTAKTGTVGLD